MRAHEIEHGILQIEMTLKELFLFGMRECFAYQASIALTGGEIITLDIRGVDLRTAAIGSQDLHNVGLAA